MTMPALPAASPTVTAAQSAPTLALPVLPLQTATPESLPQIDLTVAPRPPSKLAPTIPERPQVRPKRATAPSRPRETASGNGQNTTAGTVKTTAPDAAPAPRTNPAAFSQWGASIRNSVERRKRYPSGTRASGTVKLAITVNASGSLAGVSVAGSSGDSALDRAALAAYCQSWG